MKDNDWDKIYRVYKLMKIIGKNGCDVLPEGLFCGFDDWMIEKVTNLILCDYKENVHQFKLKHKLIETLPSKVNMIKVRNDEIVNEILSSNGKLTVDDYEKELDTENRINKVCNKIVAVLKENNFKNMVECGVWTGLGSYEKATVERLNLKTINPFIDHSNSVKIKIEGFGDIIVTGHAIDRLRMRNEKLFSASDTKVLKWLKNDLKSSKKARIKSKYAVLQLLNHKFEKTTYRMNKEGMVYVFVGNTLKTVHGNESNRYAVM